MKYKVINAIVILVFASILVFAIGKTMQKSKNSLKSAKQWV